MAFYRSVNPAPAALSGFRRGTTGGGFRGKPFCLILLFFKSSLKNKIDEEQQPDKLKVSYYNIQDHF